MEKKQEEIKETTSEDLTKDSCEQEEALNENTKEAEKVEAEVVEEEKINYEEEVFKLKDENMKLVNELDTYKDRLLRTVAEYDNYRKRTAKEKETIYTDACFDVLKNIIPVMDNLERAADIAKDNDDIKKGLDMTINIFKDALEKLGVKEVDTNCEFDPNMHNAVMHVQDEQYKEKEILEVFQKGYIKGDKILRYSMVKVAN